MKNLFNYVPGFRSDTKWKKIVATIYYLTGFTSLSDSIWHFIFTLSIPFMVFGFINILKNVKRLKSNPKIIASFIIPLVIVGLSATLVSEIIEESNKQSIPQEQQQEKTKDNEKEIEFQKEEDLKQEELVKLTLIKKEEEAKLQEEKRLEEEAKRQEEIRLAEEAEKKKAEEEAKKQEEIRLAEEAAKAEEARRQEEAKKVEQEKKEKEAQVAKSQQAEKSNTNSSTSKPVANNSAPVKAPADNTAQVFITPTGKKYHSRKCGRGNFSSSTLDVAKSRGLTACSKCY